MIGDLPDISKMEEGSMKLHLREVSPAALVKRAVAKAT
jgi:hypothetical protein